MENYKIIPFEDQYEVSSEGNVRNINTKHVKSLRYDRYGYLRVTLYPSGKTYSVHRLVGLVWMADSFVEGLEIDHLNAKRDDNHLSNLEWVTQQENVDRIKVRYRGIGSKNVMASISEEDAFAIKYCFTETATDLALKYNTTAGVVETIRRRERWCHILDVGLEGKFMRGELVYLKGKTANLSECQQKALDIDLLSRDFSTKDLTLKYGCSKSTVCRRRRNLGL